MESLGRTLLILGVVLALIGAWLVFGPGVPWLGRLPGDLRIERPGWSLYFPITTCVILSAVLSLAIYLFQRLR